MDDQYIWDVVYNMDGYGLSDYLNDWDATKNYSGRGDAVFIRLEDGDILEIFSDFSKWRQEVSYYFNGFIENWENIYKELNDNAIDVFVYKVCAVLNLTKDNWKIPANTDKFLFC